MSRVYFHTPTAYAELSGAERLWLGHVGRAAGREAWGLDAGAPSSYANAKALIGMLSDATDSAGQPLNPFADSLRERVNAAEQACARGDYSMCEAVVTATSTALRVGGLHLNVHGVKLCSTDLECNTALVAGSDSVALAAKLFAWCRAHCWVEGAARGWLADVISRGLQAGLFRDGHGWERPREGDHGPGVIPLLLKRHDEPVVLSYSVDDGFPNPFIDEELNTTDGQPPVAASFGQEEALDRLTEWNALPYDEKWHTAMRDLRQHRPWARLAPETLRHQTFWAPVTVHDVMRPDRAEHLRTTLATWPGFRNESPAHA